jgi:hypothetical protein
MLRRAFLALSAVTWPTAVAEELKPKLDADEPRLIKEGEAPR